MRHAAYDARASRPDVEPTKFEAQCTRWMHSASGILGLDLGDWRCERTGKRIAKWVLDPKKLKFVCDRAAMERWMGQHVSAGCRTTLIRHAAPALCAAGRMVRQTAIELKCSEGTVKRALRLAGHRQRKPWTKEELRAIRAALKTQGRRSERKVLRDVARIIDRPVETVRTQARRMSTTLAQNNVVKLAA